MPTFWGVITAFTMIGGLPTVGGLWAFERWRSRRRNRNGECAVCGTAWSASGDPYLIHGSIVCEGCGEKARRRMPWHLGMIGLLGALGTGLAVAGAEMAVMILLPATSTIAMTLGAVALMKHANRRTQHRISNGEYADLNVLRLRARSDYASSAST